MLAIRALFAALASLVFLTTLLKNNFTMILKRIMSFVVIKRR